MLPMQHGRQRSALAPVRGSFLCALCAAGQGSGCGQVNGFGACSGATAHCSGRVTEGGQTLNQTVKNTMADTAGETTLSLHSASLDIIFHPQQSDASLRKRTRSCRHRRPDSWFSMELARGYGFGRIRGG